MKAAIFNPYLDTLGGGERYTMAVATILQKAGYKVYVEWSDPKIKPKLEDRFGIYLEDINFVGDINRGDGYDVCFWVSDGSIPALRSRKNFLHFQVPFTKVGGRTLLNKIKLSRVRRVICNSEFTEKIIDQEFGVNSVVLYPPVAIEKFKSRKKENVILNVARFSTLLQAKRQDVLVEAFRVFSRENKGWVLVLAGGVEVGAEEYFNKLNEMSKGLPVKIIKSPKFEVLQELYGHAKIFWSASGFGVNEEMEPKKVEHFGITLVEAMAAGVVPVAYEAGGHKEIINNGENGYLWRIKEELVRKTNDLVDDEKVFKQFSEKAITSAQKFSYERFEKEFLELI
jgi:glycosyltransferase involved in cell wall biosynthesis